jgi:hypothetical protein
MIAREEIDPSPNLPMRLYCEGMLGIYAEGARRSAAS